jgi:Flp pilus assembly protein TadD
MGQSRFEQAASELGRELAGNPDHAPARALLSTCLAELGRDEEAESEARATIAASPDFAFAHYALASVLEGQDRLDEAERSVGEALRLDAENSASHALLASIHLQRRQWEPGLAAAERGLYIDPESTECANLRAIALRQLGRSREAGREIASALERDPEDAVTHVNQGWQLVELGRYDGAMEHFREALRLDPTLDLAREGVVEVLRARNPIYRIFLRYFLFMSKLQGWAVWGVIIGFVLVSRILRTAMKQNPELMPFLMPLFVILVLFMVFTWISQPVFNLMLRLDPLGRLALTRDEIRVSNWVGGLLLAFGVLGVLWYVTWFHPLAIAALACGLMVVPISGTTQCETAHSRNILRRYTIVLALLAVLAVALSFVSLIAAAIPGVAFLVGFWAYGWVANALILKT